MTEILGRGKTGITVTNMLKNLPSSPWAQEIKTNQSKKLTVQQKQPKKGPIRKANITWEHFCHDVDSGKFEKDPWLYIDSYPDYVRLKIEEDILFLAYHILGYKWDGKEGLCNPPDPIHIDMREFFDREERYKLGEYARGTYKSTLISICRPTQYLCRDFEDTIGIVGETWSLAKQRLVAIQAHLEQNEMLIKLYGEFMPKRRWKSSLWNQKAINIAQRKNLTKLTEPSIATAGLDSKKTGWHPRHLIIDDPVSDNNVTTPEQIQKVINYLDGYIDLASTCGDITIIGTPRQPDDPYAYIINKWKDIIDETTGKKLFAFRNLPIWNNETENMLVMPSKYSAAAIRTLRNTKPIKTFATQYLCNPCAGGNTLVRKEDLNATEYFDSFANTHLNEKWWGYVAFDPGKSLQVRRCYTGIVLGIPVLPYDLYFDEALRLKLEPSGIIEEVINLLMRPHYLGHIRMVGVEVNAFQEIYEGSLLNAIHRKADFLESEGNEEAARLLRYVNVYPIQTQVNKDDRIYAMEPYYRHRQIHIRVGSPGLQYLRHQVGSYPNISETNRDLVDATTFFMEMLPAWLVNPYGIINVDVNKPNKKQKGVWWFPRKAGDEDYFRKRSGGLCY